MPPTESSVNHPPAEIFPRLWLQGKIVRYIKSRKVHVIEYDDGDMEEVGLPDKTIQVVDD